MNPTTLKSWLHRGEIEKLENVVLEGRGARLLGENSPDLRTRVFLKSLPNYLTKIATVHEAVSRGCLTEAQKLITDEPKKKLAYAKDPSGTPLLHKAVYYDQQHIVDWLVQNYPSTTQQKDKEGRTALHYCAACRDPEAVWDVLIEAGCDAAVCDKKGNPAAYYLEHSSEIELPDTDKMAFRKISSSKENLDFKPSNIRIWIHNRDIGKLQQVLWEGHGNKLRRETSNNPRVKKFLEAVPFIMVTVRDIHAAVVKNDLNIFKKLVEYPVSPIILSSKDSNGHNVLHKAAGLGYLEMAREILEMYQPAVAAEDHNGRTPLHYAAAAKDGGTMYDLLIEYGADGSKLDNKQKAAAFYKNRPSDIDMTNLELIPDAPRTLGTPYPKNWDWRILEMEEIGLRGLKKIGTNVDSAFGSAESTWKGSGASNKEENTEVNDPGKHAGQTKVAKDSNPNAEETRQGQEETNPEETEEKSSDDDVVIADISNETKEEHAENEVPAENTVLQNGVDKPNHQEERNEPSTGDSGVDDAPNDEDQIIAGEHEELPDSELNDGRMAVDPEVEELLENGNMEELASLVLNGEGRRLVGRQTNNPELQAFIDNVPSYMGKIHAVHMAAREGNLRDLQSALDRRKFAIARDGSSPNGATPLHVAVVFGNTAIIRYLAGRFPETAHATDMDGRTPLHYAATLADNGHYYNLLLHLGANPLVLDNFGHKAEYYKENQGELSHKKLLRAFGASESLADEMLTDKVPGGDTYSARRDVSEPETLATLERCFRLLAGGRRGSNPKTPTAGTLLGRCLKRPVFDRVKHRVTRMDHNLFDVIWPALRKYGNPASRSNASSARSNVLANANEDDPSGSVVAPDYESYVVFAELLEPMIRELHCVTVSGDLPDQPPPWFFNVPHGTENMIDQETVALIEAHDLDPAGKYVMAGSVECSRNLEDYTLPLTLTVNQLEEVEHEITSELMNPEISTMLAEGSSEDEAGSYFTLNEVLDQPSPIRMQLATAGLLMPITEFEYSDSRRLHGAHWPYGRGVYVAAAGDLAIWVNVQDHLRIVCRTNESKAGLIGMAYVRLARVMTILDQRLRFKRDRKLGFLVSRPYAIGNTLRITLFVKFPGLSKEPDNLRHLCVVRGLSVKDTERPDTFRIGNQQSLSITELQTLHDFSRAIQNILSLEKELVLNNSMRIASLISGIFRKRTSKSRSLRS